LALVKAKLHSTIKKQSKLIENGAFIRWLGYENEGDMGGWGWGYCGRDAMLSILSLVI